MKNNISEIIIMNNQNGISDKSFTGNQYIDAFIIIAIIVYSSLGALNPPSFLKNMFKNEMFRFVFLSLILIHGFRTTPHIALFIALAFIVTGYYINKQETMENFAYLETYKGLVRNKKTTYKTSKFN